MNIKVIKGDITKLRVGAVVNAANSSLLGGVGVDGAIHRAAGPELLEECKKLGGCATGEAKLTKGYKLPAKYVIHTVGPIYGREHGKEAQLLANCYENCLKLAKEHKIRTIAFPAISTGAYNYPKKEAAKIAIQTVKDFCAQNPDSFDEIIFVCFDDENYRIYNELQTNG
jgi:O-acetyl-ADP-ribose deacetylase (regulator of RNase III)